MLAMYFYEYLCQPNTRVGWLIAMAAALVTWGTTMERMRIQVT